MDQAWRGIISVLDRRESEGEYPSWESGSHLSAQCGLATRGQTSFKGKPPNGGKFCSREIMFRFQIMRVLVIYFGMRNAFLTRSLQEPLYTNWRWDLKCFACKIVVSDIVYHHTVLRISLPRLHCSLLVSPTISGRAVSLSLTRAHQLFKVYHVKAFCLCRERAGEASREWRHT